MPKSNVPEPIRKVVVAGSCLILIVLFVIILEGIRESSGNNPAVNEAIDNAESQLGVTGETSNTCDCSSWKIAFWMLLVIVVIVAAVMITIKLYDNYSNKDVFNS